MRKLAFRHDLVLTVLFFVFSLCFYLSSRNVEHSSTREKRFANLMTGKGHKPSESDLNPELKNASYGNIEESNYEENLTSKNIKPKILIILASLPRSGSTMISELLRSRENTVLFFEPDHKTEVTSCAAVPECISDYLRDILTCNFNDEFETWLRNKFFSYFHQKVKNCPNATCKKKINMRAMCRKAEFTLTKLIRLPLGFFESLLSDPTIDAKIIHLIRDPRPALISNIKMGWVANPILKCSKVYKDQLAYDYFKEKYPHQIMQVQYEKFCLDPTGITKSMYLFAYGDHNLPKPTIKYLQKHTEVEAVGAMNTQRISNEFYQVWRWKIKESKFKEIENDEMCQKSIRKLNYRLFETINNVRNANISLFLD